MHCRHAIVFAVAVSLAGCASGGGSGADVARADGVAAGGAGAASTQTENAVARNAERSGSTAAYAVVDLGTLGGTSSDAASINETFWTTGTANLAGDDSAQATLWRHGSAGRSLGTLGGLNSGVAWPVHNNVGLISGISETAATDPLAEDWSCQAFFPTIPDTKHVCLGFAWHDGRMRALPTLGGINGYGAGDNDEGAIVGWAETPVHDRTCSAVTHFPASFYQVLQFLPVVWNGLEPERPPVVLKTVHGDPDGSATAINDFGTVVGISGACDQAVGRFTAEHAVVWQNGVPTDIGNFDGGIAWNTPTAVNAFGMVVGFMNEPGDAQGQFQPVGFAWTRWGGLHRIAPLPGDSNALASGVNDLGQVVGQSYDATTGAARAFIWENGRTYDLNTFVPAGSPLYLIAGNDIDDRGDIVGQAVDASGSTTPAFLAIPPYGWNPATATPLRSSTTAPRLSATMRRAMFSRNGLPVPTAP